ncbi:Cecropin-B [Eumeta japonica]|uniref:Cecropin-B n=1 Tax=Eumeta variegata TaxID=151549 RepID=A0A4C1TX45_EUMVA|nr:Cecropin-B [Eumeta japonica]
MTQFNNYFVWFFRPGTPGHKSYSTYKSRDQQGSTSFASSIFERNTSSQSVTMKYFSVAFVLVLLAVALATVSAAPNPGWGFLKDIEKMGRRVRDSVISAGPAVAVLSNTKALG